jgi:hypothetical protein
MGADRTIVTAARAAAVRRPWRATSRAASRLPAGRNRASLPSHTVISGIANRKPLTMTITPAVAISYLRIEIP